MEEVIVTIRGIDPRPVTAAADGWRVYAVIWLVIFAETGFVVTGILPSDTVLFAASALAARGTLSVWPILVDGMLAAFCGDQCNYVVGRWLGRAFGRGRALPGVGLAFCDMPEALAAELARLGCKPVDFEVASGAKGP